ncbi:CDP-glycerol glycerophosphotransferase family protein [Hellea sp.]|nr:CDP-glycerol glycerophosphotransferase family protein [Hellea sp.]
MTSSADDPGLKIEHPRLSTFIIGEGFVRDWMFANMDTDIMVMTMPDLGQYQVKRSSHPVKYVYVQHSLVSLHMVYRRGAFDFYDVIFCAGPHHIEELNALQAQRGFAPKAIFKHGYARLDSIVKEKAQREGIKKASQDSKHHYLIAPSWGPNGTIETGLGEKIVDLLLSNDARVTLRPHPQTIKFAPERIKPILDKHSNHPNFVYENNVQGQDSLHDSDTMICDWSGAALDYAFGLGKPVIFIDVDRKVNNPDYKEIDITPFEVNIRASLGAVISPDKLEAILNVDIKPLPKDLADKHVYNVGQSDDVGAHEIIRLLTA